jgi:hypothetical protein
MCVDNLSSDDAVAYEVALDAVNELIGGYSAKLENSPGDARAEFWTTERHRLAELVRALDPGDSVQIARIRSTFPALARELRES